MLACLTEIMVESVNSNERHKDYPDENYENITGSGVFYWKITNIDYSGCIYCSTRCLLPGHI